MNGWLGKFEKGLFVEIGLVFSVKSRTMLGKP